MHQDFDRESAAGVVFFWQHVLIYSGTVRLSQVKSLSLSIVSN
jgi:hypothetical protein